MIVELLHSSFLILHRLADHSTLHIPHSFKGLAIDALEKDWTEYPVLHFDMSGFKYSDVDVVREKFDYMLHDYEARLGISTHYTSPGTRFKNIVKHLYKETGKQLVVIIDEYDAPLLDVLHNPVRLEEVRNIMQEFYAPIKECDEYWRFAFITGITKFSQLSIFSTINNLANISMDSEFAAICGITAEELTTTLSQDIEIMAGHNGVSKDEMERILKENYDGYHFTRNSPDIFNPFSLMRAFASGETDNYWFASGTSTYLVHQMQNFILMLPPLMRCLRSHHLSTVRQKGCRMLCRCSIKVVTSRLKATIR